MQQNPPGTRSQKRPHQPLTGLAKDGGVDEATSRGIRQMDIHIEPNGGIRATASGLEAVHAGAAVLEAHIHSQAKLKFGLYALASLFVIVAAALVVFAPGGRETISSILAAALLVVAVGCAGFSTFAIKTPVIDAQAGINTRPDQHRDVVRQLDIPAA
jgi:hypothetical protein